MCPYILIFNHLIPTYGLMILTGLILANVISVHLLHKYKADINEWIVCEGYLLLGAVLGAKLLYLWVSRDQIAWKNITDMEYFNQLMRGGFVFYGGLLGGLSFLAVGGRIHKINLSFYIRKFLFLIPFIHGFGRIGCFLAGCCYGIPYHGIGAVTYPAHSFAPAGISLFPVQLVEAVLLFLLSLFLFVASTSEKSESKGMLYYLIGYGTIRFFLEFLRFDAKERGYLFFLSTSQWISVFIIAVTFFFYQKKESEGEKC